MSTFDLGSDAGGGGGGGETASRVDVMIQVSAEDTGAEVFLLDRTFRVVQMGIGRFAAPSEQPPGLYRVRARIGTSVRETHLVVEPGDVRLVGTGSGIRLLSSTDEESVHVHFDALEFSSPLPLNNTSNTHEYHRESAKIVSAAEPQVILGDGGEAHLFLYARAWSSGHDHPYHGWNPVEGLSLVGVDGDVLFDFARTKTYDLTQDPWSACRLKLSPGSYRLRYTLDGRMTEMSLLVSRNWQLHVFLLARRRADGKAELDLASAAIFHSRGGFTDGSREARLCEQVRFGLAQRRRTMDPIELQSLVDEKFDNPMLGLYGAHMMLMSDNVESSRSPRELPREDRIALEIITKNLSLLLGVHPDVEALRVYLGMQPAQGAFHHPPMFLSSWEIIVRATRNQPDLIPSRCLSAQVAPRILSSAPWLMWNAHTLSSLEAPATSDRSAQTRVSTYLAFLRNVQDLEGPDSVREITEYPAHYYRYANVSRRAQEEANRSWLAGKMVDALGLPMSSVLDALARIDKQAETLVAARSTAPSACFAILEDPLVKSARGLTRTVARQRAKWPTGANISVSFLGGDPDVHRRVEDVARLWTKEGDGPANVTFQFRKDTTATNVRIAFQKGGAWSRVGTTCLRVHQPLPTMNLGWLTPESTDDELRAVVLHEFGHVLGMVHEHLPWPMWNKMVVYFELAEQGWSREQVDLNLFNPWLQQETNFAAVDRNSIMMCPIPEEWTLNGAGIGLNKYLSAMDRMSVSELYPQ